MDDEPTMERHPADLVHIESQLGEILARLTSMEAEVERLRTWRHDLADRLAPLLTVPQLILSLNDELKHVTRRLYEIETKLALADGERQARERMAVWVRWAVPGSWLVAGLLALAAWWRSFQ